MEFGGCGWWSVGGKDGLGVLGVARGDGLGVARGDGLGVARGGDGLGVA